MKIKRIIILVVFIVAFVGYDLWKFKRPTEGAEPMTSPAPTPVPLQPAQVAPKPVALAPKTVATPVAPVAVTTVATPVAKAAELAAAGDPQADLKTALPEMAQKVRDNHFVALYQAYTQPDNLTPELLQKAQKMEQTYQKIIDQAQAGAVSPATSAPRTNPLDRLAQIYESLANQTPILNATGDEATFHWPAGTPAENKPPVMIKINGKWYMKDNF